MQIKPLHQCVSGAEMNNSATWPETKVAIEVISMYRKKGRRNVPFCKFS